ncbi:DedA family protein [Paenibacillus ginsengarvi]|uniref:DedA family protein n=1 Tax=Paenibacillus ginsengarvi TaxID=400777 RepID=A0A3B0BJD4_9BACL|nr:DedA family protein [Paenibacillus ginsengarvi]RKN71897.1 DedA family protein [Paenibacillus ginsengarvi]
MSYDGLLALIQQFGYAALFFALWLGIVGMPIPDEVIVMTGGAVTASGLLHVVPAFILTYLGVVSGLSLGYFLGRWLGTPMLERLKRKKKMDKYLAQSERLVTKYGSFALCIGYFFPVVRHVVPYLVGLGKMSFKRYALFSYTTGFVWTLIFFTLGRLVGDHAKEIGYFLHSYGLKLIWIPVAAIAVVAIVRFRRARRSQQGRSIQCVNSVNNVSSVKDQ